jgi:hypothetical protein
MPARKICLSVWALSSPSTRKSCKPFAPRSCLSKAIRRQFAQNAAPGIQHDNGWRTLRSLLRDPPIPSRVDVSPAFARWGSVLLYAARSCHTTQCWAFVLAYEHQSWVGLRSPCAFVHFAEVAGSRLSSSTLSVSGEPESDPFSLRDPPIPSG